MKYAWILALVTLAAACTPAEDFSEVQYITPEATDDSGGGSSIPPLEACWMSWGAYVGFVEYTDVSEVEPDVCEGTTRRAHRVVQFRTREPVMGDITSGAFISVATDYPREPGQRALIKLFEMPNGELAAAAEVRTIPGDESIPDGWVEVPGTLSTNVDDAVRELQTTVPCDDPPVPDTNELAEYYATPDAVACP